MPSRTVAVTQDDPFFTGRFFETFLPAAREAGAEVVEIVLLRNFNESRLALLRRFASFYSPLELARLSGRYARAWWDDRHGRPRSVEALAAAHGVPVRSLDTINDPAYLATLPERQVDILLSVAAPEIFRPETLRAVPLTLNVHSGHLPDFRGMMPTFWALLEGRDHVTATVHEMAEQLDAGDVIAEHEVPIGPGDTAFDVSRNAKEVAGREVAGLLATLGSERRPEGRPLDLGRGRYFGFPGREDVRKLRAAGRRLL
jgi:methionyl-tRNA formyltransferase